MRFSPAWKKLEYLSGPLSLGCFSIVYGEGYVMCVPLWTAAEEFSAGWEDRRRSWELDRWPQEKSLREE